MEKLTAQLTPTFLSTLFEVLPDSLASGLGDSVAQYIGFLHQLGGIDATLLEEKEATCRQK